jgi:hypothetical protein
VVNVKNHPSRVSARNASGQQSKTKKCEKMQTILTKYLGATNHKGSRIKATNSGKSKSVTISYDYALSTTDNHRKAAAALKAKLRWPGRMIGGHTEPGMVWVFDNEGAEI